MADALYELGTLPEVAELAAHAETHPNPLDVIAHGAKFTRCQSCGNAWRGAWLAIHAHELRLSFGDSARILAEWAECFAEWNGVTFCVIRSAVIA